MIVYCAFCWRAVDKDVADEYWYFADGEYYCSPKCLKCMEAYVNVSSQS